ncbi:MAG TPA: hypothetical protein ENF25_03955 [Thermoprotei archaeon]|nr:hypothetical protein [Thermoprotei archaeon]
MVWKRKRRKYKMLIEGKIAWTIITLVFSIAMVTILYLSSKKIYIPDIREHPGVQAIVEAIGRAVEMGRPVCFSPGTQSLYSTKYAGDTSAALTILGYTAREAAKSGAKLIVGIAPPTVLPVAEDIVRTAYLLEGKPDEYIEGETVQFYSPNQWGFATSYVGMMHRERAAANFLFGGHAAEAMVIAESGATVGAMQVAGSTNVYQIPFFIVACDYTLIGEDEYAAAAYLSPDPVQKGIIFGQDIAKIICVALILLGSLFTTAGIDFITKLLSM